MTATGHPVIIGVDVGTGSARAGVFDLDGTMLASAVRPIRQWRPCADFIQQSSTDIWNAVCDAVRSACADAVRSACADAGANAGANAGTGIDVRGIGFDATCSLVVLDENTNPLSVDPAGAPDQDVILWADHRALAEADAINDGDHEVLRYVGGRISLEMETPKLLWLKQHHPETWQRAAHFFDLPDYLTFRATGAVSRSLCSTVCKWTYLGHESRWDEAYFRAIGLGDLADEGFRRIGTEILPMGAPVGHGLSAEAAAAFGLTTGIPVGASAIDAHAGGLGVIGAALDGVSPDDASLHQRLALIGGTSSCHMAVSPSPHFVPGVWGPYFSAMMPGLWLNEGGQSATGALIDHVITTHAAHDSLRERAAAHKVTVYQVLNEILAADTAAGSASPTRDLHVFPDFHGNRSPRADATLRGMISGLKLSAGEQDCALLYLATIQAVAYGTRHIIETMNENGYAIDTIFMTGGGTKNPVFLREHANATGCRLVLPAEPEAVLLGAAILGAVAAGAYSDIRTAMAAMSRAGTIIEPDSAAADFHARKYKVFLRMYADQLAYRALMG